MNGNLNGKRIAILVEQGFEQVELVEPRKALEQAGARVEIVSPRQGKVRGWNHTEWGDEVGVDKPLDSAREADYDGLMLPGGVMNPDKLRMNEKAVQLVRAFFDAGKPIAAICHAPWLLAEAGVVGGVRLTSYPSLKTDLRNAGAEWADEECIVDRGLVTSRKPDDIPAFNRKMIEEFAEGRHSGRRTMTAGGTR
ncbi:MAG TPA: type 1 glutamine amidotransferase domain-containing protein [Vicinamibacterales bacterium]|nr:type 1 glutamine amidotransferase [Acidobacteriota bacterium]HOC17857.1 type 1 glutamine amidotransferase domain-containing protein [Vicinamibacterales bacterium]